MSTLQKTGYQQDNQGSWIEKDPEAELIYSMDWSQWLATGDGINTVDYALQVRANDPDPLLKLSQGKTANDTVTFVELGGGQIGKTYTVTATIVTQDGSKDRRSFRIKVQDRSA
jgi:hypothetical protein